MLYFTNSLGAAMGVLASGFIFIHYLDAGDYYHFRFLNVLVAFSTYWLTTCSQVQNDKSAFECGNDVIPNVILYRMVLVVSLLTGMASFCYEIGWIRMLSIVLGSSTHSFELMLSAFILGLALGGLWIKFKIDKMQQPLQVGIIQLCMGFSHR